MNQNDIDYAMKWFLDSGMSAEKATKLVVAYVVLADATKTFDAADAAHSAAYRVYAKAKSVFRKTTKTFVDANAVYSAAYVDANAVYSAAYDVFTKANAIYEKATKTFADANAVYSAIYDAASLDNK